MNPRYERRGACVQCGTCCLTEDCEHFENNRCLIFGMPSRFDKCTSHPQAPPIMIKTCGYYFYDTWENRDVRGTDI